MRPPSPWRGDPYERESPARELSPSYSSPDGRLSEPPLWHEGDDAVHGKPFVTPVLASDLKATVSPRAVFMPQSGSDSEWEEDLLPSPIPSHDSLAAKARRPLSPVPSSSFASSSQLVAQQPPPTIFANPLKPEKRPPTPGPSKRRATGKVKAPKDATIGIVPQGLVAKLKASPVHRDLVISQVFERQNGRYWSVVFTDGSKCCVCNLSDGTSCKRVCTNSRGINRHFRAAPHFLGQELHCNHPTHPCGASFMRQDVLTRHLATPHPVERHTRGEDGPTSGKRTTAKSSRVARGKPY